MPRFVSHVASVSMKKGGSSGGGGGTKGGSNSKGGGKGGGKGGPSPPKETTSIEQVQKIQNSCCQICPENFFADSSFLQIHHNYKKINAIKKFRYYHKTKNPYDYDKKKHIYNKILLEISSNLNNNLNNNLIAIHSARGDANNIQNHENILFKTNKDIELEPLPVCYNVVL